jgi:hypothetical protein
MKNVHPLKAERRRQRRLAVLRTENPCCPLCGETALECLEVHEIAGFRRDADSQTIVCRNCHRKLTSGLLDAGVPMVRERCPLERAAQIVATRHRYIGKETSRRWEQGDDLSLVDFRCAEYVDGKMKADAATRKRIVEIGIRKVARETGINRETVALVANDGTVKPRTMRKIADFLAKGVN